MQFLLSFLDISLVLGVVALVLLITSGLVSSYLGRSGLAIERKVLKRGTFMFSFAFLFTVVVRLYQILSAA